jgi:hypothetical protein
MGIWHFGICHDAAAPEWTGVVAAAQEEQFLKKT